MSDISARLAAAIEIATAAGERLLERFRARRPGAVAYKGVRDVVTDADREAEALIVERLRAAFPADAVVAEEGAVVEGGSSADGTWYVDPLDGTVNFAHGYPHWAVSIACVRAGRVEVGVVRDAVRGETFAAAAGHDIHAPRGTVPLGVTATPVLDQAVILTGFAMLRGPSPDRRAIEALGRVALATEGLRRAGAATLDLAWVACGRADGFYEWGLKPWDVAAGGCLVEAAGGVVTDLEGGSEWLSRGAVVAANPRLHAALRAAVRG